MSKIKVQQPIVHTPSFKKWGVPRHYYVAKLKALGIKPFPEGFILDQWFYYTNREGWSVVLPDLVFKSSLYKKDKFDCEDYALKAMVVCAERYGLNSFRICISPSHGFNQFSIGDQTGIETVMLWEPNMGYDWSGEPFEIGEHGYKPEASLV